MDSPAEKAVDGEALKQRGNTYLERINAAEKREEKWRKDAAAAEKAYAAGCTDDHDGNVYSFNILHSNVETIVPAIYNSTPVPDIRPRRVEATGPKPKPPQGNPQQPPDPNQIAQFQQAMQVYAQKEQADKDAKAYATMLERAIAVQVDDNRLDSEIEDAARDSYSAGRGLVRLRFEGEYGQSEAITFESVSWRDYREGPATRWGEVPWIAFRVPMARETYERIVDEDMVASQPVAKEDGTADQPDEIVIWEYWDKLTGTVCFVREDDGRIVREEPDPLGLPGFFPIPAPLQPITLTARRTPVCPFAIYRELADELDKVTKRINAIMKGLKVRGVVAGNAESISKLADAGDNELVVEANLEQLIQTGGLEKAIAWWPVDRAIVVLRELYAQREQVKQAIYEITGISDIVRGASNAGETATAQQIKTQWGSLRIQKMQRLIERQVRDVFVMMAHLISTKFSPETLVRMTGIEMTPGVQALMQSPAEANYRINVESDSTVRADLTNQKREMQEFLAGSGQYFGTVGPIIQAQPMAAEPLAEIYASMARVFRLGKSAEDALDRFVAMAKGAAENPPPNPEAEKNKMEAEKAKAEMGLKEKELGLKAEETKAKVGLDAAKLELEREKLGIEKQRAAFEGEKLTAEQAKLLMDGRKLDMEGERMAMDRDNAVEDRRMRMAESRLTATDDGDLQNEGERMLSALTELVDSVRQTNEGMVEAIAKIAASVTAPKRVVRGERGEIVGVEAANG